MLRPGGGGRGELLEAFASRTRPLSPLSLDQFARARSRADAAFDETPQAKPIDLMQIHNSWTGAPPAHPAGMESRRDSPLPRHIPYTPSAYPQWGRSCARTRSFVQLNYSIDEREAEGAAAPLAADLGIASSSTAPSAAADCSASCASDPCPPGPRTSAAPAGQLLLNSCSGIPRSPGHPRTGKPRT